MAVTISAYNGTTAFIVNKGVANLTLKVMLLTDDATFDATDTALTDVSNAGAYEVDGNGWTTGGETLANVAVSVVTTNDAKLDADNVEATASSGSIGPAYKAVVYDDSDGSDRPLWFIDFGGAQEAGDGTDFNIIWNASGIETYTRA